MRDAAAAHRCRASFRSAGSMSNRPVSCCSPTTASSLPRLTHPRYHVPRTYRVKVSGAPDERALGRLRRGVQLADGPTGPVEVSVEERCRRRRGCGSRCTRAARIWSARLCEAIGHRAEKLQRVRHRTARAREAADRRFPRVWRRAEIHRAPSRRRPRSAPLRRRASSPPRTRRRRPRYGGVASRPHPLNVACRAPRYPGAAHVDEPRWRAEDGLSVRRVTLIGARRARSYLWETPCRTMARSWSVPGARVTVR